MLRMMKMKHTHNYMHWKLIKIPSRELEFSVLLLINLPRLNIQLAFKTSKVVIETRLCACWLLSKLITRLQLLELKGHKVIWHFARLLTAATSRCCPGCLLRIRAAESSSYLLSPSVVARSLIIFITHLPPNSHTTVMIMSTIKNWLVLLHLKCWNKLWSQSNLVSTICLIFWKKLYESEICSFHPWLAYKSPFS